MTDLYFQEQGSIWLVPPATPKAEAWMTDYPSVRIRWFGATEIDRCFAQEARVADGLDVRIDAA